MKSNYTDITVVLDRSGSMEKVREDTIGGFNGFLNEQKNTPGQATITLVQFDDQYQIDYEAIAVQHARPLNTSTFVPRGWTALLDAIGRAINATGARLAKIPEAQRPEKVVFVILTDGEENSSKEFSLGRINKMIQHQKDIYSWEFVFLGANLDAITVAKNLGINTSHALHYAHNAAGTQAAFSSLSKNVQDYRQGKVGTSAFLDKDREDQRVIFDVELKIKKNK